MMSRRKQSNPKPIKHDDDNGDEMDGCISNTTASDCPLPAVAAKENPSSQTVWENSQHPHLETLPGGIHISSEPPQQKDNKAENSETEVLKSKSLKTRQDEMDKAGTEKEEDTDFRDDKDAIRPPASVENKFNQKVMTSITKSISDEDIKVAAKVYNVAAEQAGLCLRDSRISPPLDSGIKGPPPDSKAISLSFKSYGDPLESDTTHVMSQHSQLSGSDFSAMDGLGNNALPNINNDSEEEEDSRPSFMTRFPIIPNGKSSTNSSKIMSLHRHPMEDSNKTKQDNVNIDKSENESSDIPAVSATDTKCSSTLRMSPAVSPSTGTNRLDTDLARCQEEAELALVNQLQLPSDVLYLRQQEVSIHGTLNLGWVVCCAIPLPQNSSLGPFQGQLVAPEDVKVGDLIVQFTNKRGQQALMNVAGQSGGWLALLRTPQTPAQRNTHVYWEGGRIWCEIVSDIEMGTELRATFSFQHDEEEDEAEEGQREQRADLVEHTKTSRSSPLRSDTGSCDVTKVKLEPPSLNDTNSNDPCDGSSISIPQPHQHQLPPHPHQQQPSPGHAALIYGCPFCGVRFSSPRTLQGHLSFYCSKKTSDSTVYTPAAGSSGGSAAQHNKGPAQARVDACHIKQEPGQRSPEERGTKRRASDTEEASDTNTHRSPTPHAAKISAARMSRRSSPEISSGHIDEDDIYECDRCSFRTDRISSMNNHKRMHANENAANLSSRTQKRVESSASRLNRSLRDTERLSLSSSLKTPSSETFCKECKIQFSSMRTFKCHKEHYCAQRRKKSLAEPSPFSAMFNSPFHFPSDSARASAGLPSALHMSALSQRGLILPERNEMTAAAAAAAMILQANMAAMSLPGLIIHQRDIGTTSDVLLRHPAVVKGPPRDNTKASSPKMQHPLQQALPNLESKTEPEQIALTPKRTANRSTSPPKSPVKQPIVLNEAVGITSHSHYLENKVLYAKAKPDALGRDELQEEEHPLDLSVSKTEGNQTREKSSASPDLTDNRNKMLELDQSSLSSDSTSGLLPGIQPILSPQTRRIQVQDSAHSIGDLRKDIIPSEAAYSHFLAHANNPSLSLSTSGYYGILPSSPVSDRALNAFQQAKRRRPDSPNAVARNISKCLDCNIVFYKHDNYLVHKQYYCSGKRRPLQTSSRPVTPSPPSAHPVDTAPPSPKTSLPPHSPHRSMETSPASSSGSLKVPSPQPLQSSKSPAKQQQAGKMKYKFYCVPCRIKFSNASILEAHKEYYCPAGKDSEQSVILQSATSFSEDPSSQVGSQLSPREVDDDLRGDNSSPEPQHEDVTCTRCNSVFTSARLLRLHVCEGGFPCPHCDHVAITENRLSEHLKVHAPTRAYRCTICGYRGNTARGMRMHGKTHIDEGVNFTDENMLEYEEPAVMPIISHSSTSGLTGSLATDSELLRLKNEPYKRRRSRKAYEKFDYPLPKVDIPQTCPLCGQNFANADFLASHFKVHQIAASQYLAGLMKCIHCPYVGKSPEDLRAHFEANHASNHRIHFPRRVSAVETVEMQQNGELTTGKGSRSSVQADELVTSSERSSPAGTQKLMVITDPNSPLNESNVKSETEITGDERECSPSNSPFPVKIKGEPMEQEDTFSSQDEPVDHFLHMPANFSDEASGNSRSPPLRKLSVSPSVFLRRKNSPATSNEVEHENCETNKGVVIQGCPSGITIKTEPTEENDPHLASEHSSHSAQDNVPDSNRSKATSSPPNRGADRSVTMKKGVVTETHSYMSSSEREEMPNCSPVLAPSSLSMPPSMNIHIKQELQENDKPTPNFLSSPKLRRDSKAISRETSSHSLTIPNQESRISPDSVTERTVSPLTSHNSSSPKPSPTMTHPIVSPASLSSALLPIGLVPRHPLQFPYTNPQALPFFFLPGQAQLNGPRQPFLVSSREDRDSRYCQNCDIAFSKQATYLAHKKYYCTARPRGEAQPSATA